MGGIEYVMGTMKPHGYHEDAMGVTETPWTG